MKKFLPNLLLFPTLFTSTFNAPKMVAVPIIPILFYSKTQFLVIVVTCSVVGLDNAIKAPYPL